MHCAGERGADNRLQFLRFKGFHFWEKYPCFVIAPQCPARNKEGDSKWVDTGFGDPSHTMKEKATWQLQMAMALIDQTISENAVDSKRIYLTGLSMGGFATWEILQREGDRFAAAIPVCGGADLRFADRLADLPLWVFHGALDDTVKTQRSRDMVAAITAKGGHPKYTEYPDVGHGAWTATYAKPEVWDWLFAQRKK